jgi:hypothetical protein
VQLPSFRFTIRRMMIGVAIVCLFFGLVAYSQRLRMMAARHESQAFQFFNPISITGSGPPGTIGRRIPGQAGVSFYQPTPPGMEQMNIAGEYKHSAARIEKALAALLLALIIFTIGRFLVNRSSRRRPRIESPPQL